MSLLLPTSVSGGPHQHLASLVFEFSGPLRHSDVGTLELTCQNRCLTARTGVNAIAASSLAWPQIVRSWLDRTCNAGKGRIQGGAG